MSFENASVDELRLIQVQIDLFHRLFSVFSNKPDYFYNNIPMWKNVHPVSGIGIQTHILLELWVSSHNH